ncbi:MAG: Hpt domain-containing protein [Acetobacter sp.]|nr:Hpt domain-containing protein [Bacteroides sp.]MCM1340184.1 Hpt domain-containing protein [Acetobacter sp.]MCM1432864.1 Hpt domain-containing protein [Clostridiales bacterium]
MDLKECFDAFGGNYNNVMGRLLTEERVKKFLLMFLNDTSFSELEAALERNDYESAFRASHTLKGICANLGIERLGKAASEITEALRGKDNKTACELFPKVAESYNSTVDTLRKTIVE